MMYREEIVSNELPTECCLIDACYMRTPAEKMARLFELLEGHLFPTYRPLMDLQGDWNECDERDDSEVMESFYDDATDLLRLAEPEGWSLEWDTGDLRVIPRQDD